jgi:predicted nucleic acid-binding Zn ribbon protein/energy-coupling factor transporter ATP-binding protein EcfA2
MINFPVLKRLDVSEYGLYPGPPENPGLHIDFSPGLTLILGANGLGKTTLVSILYRLLAGPYDISGLDGRSGELGNINLTPTVLSVSRRSTFAQRVFDHARNSIARLVYHLGDQELVVERRLNDLTLVRLAVGEIQLEASEDLYKTTVLNLVGIGAYGDWILLLRHLIFYFEDRRALIWDGSAQRQILRFLFLSPDTANRWTADEREILELDSRMRNLSAALYKEEQVASYHEKQTEVAPDLKQELKMFEEMQARDVQRREELDDELVELDAARQSDRLSALKLEQEREARFRELERAKLLLIRAHFPTEQDTAAYILAQLLTDSHCIVCGNKAPQEIVSQYQNRIEHSHCVICDTDLSANSRTVPGTEFADKKAETASLELEKSNDQLQQARDFLRLSEERYDKHLANLTELDSAIASRTDRINQLVKRLPPAEADLRRQRSELSLLRGRVAELKKGMDTKRIIFQAFIEEMNRQIVNWSKQVKDQFNAYAEGFLLESCQLVWSPQRAKLGQTGDLISFPAFELEMTGSDFSSPTRRSGPDQVSESQREFIDLAFRIALMIVSSGGTGASLVIDAPESSLDAVFSRRAAQVLARFANSQEGNRLVITSNLTEGQLIPSLLLLSAREASPSQSRIVDLFSIAAPTAAIKQLRAEYDKVRDALITAGGGR